MDQDDCIKLWKQGRKKWNEWAEDLLAKKKAMEERDEWEAEKDFLGRIEAKNAATKDWFEQADVDFSNLWLRPSDQPQVEDETKTENSIGRTPIVLHSSEVDFSDFIFPGNVTFHNTAFDCGKVSFYKSQFSGGDADFCEAHFSGGDADFREARFNGSGVDFGEAQFSGGNANFREAQFNGGDAYFGNAQFSGGYAHFAEGQFSGDAYFGGAQFSGGETIFSAAKFSGGIADFDEAQFSGGFAFFNEAQFSGGHAVFSAAQFSGGDADFSAAQFSGGYASFREAQFSGGNIDFDRAKFDEHANFDLAGFSYPVFFRDTKFEQDASFASVTSTKSFSLADTEFARVPDFTENDFHAPPVLDDLKIAPATKRKQDSYGTDGKAKDPRPWLMRRFKTARCGTDARKYRELSKLAADAKDHQREIEYFAEEQRASRFWHDKPFGKTMGRFWWGLAYDKLSNFGRNFWRPLGLWLITTFLLFPYLYRLFAHAGYAGDNWPPIFLSLRHGLIISGLTKTGQLDAHLKTLYLVPSKLDWQVSALMMSQPLISAVWIFLFLLAVRNQFKIR